MKIRKMKQVVAGIALSAVMIGATAFNAHPAFAAKSEERVVENSIGIYRTAKELTETQKTDLKWYQEKKAAVIKAGWQLDVDNGYMSKTEMQARIVAMQERYQRALAGNMAKTPLSQEEKAMAKQFAKKYQQANRQERLAMQLEKLQKELDSGRISDKEFVARKTILQEAASHKQNKRAQSPEYRAQKTELNKQLKQLNMEYLNRCHANGSITQEQYLKLLDNMSRLQAKKATKGQ